MKNEDILRVKTKIMVMTKDDSWQYRCAVLAQALYAVLDLHSDGSKCWRCREGFCETVQTIEAALND